MSSRNTDESRDGEIISIGSLFGYEALIRKQGEFIALRGEDSPTLGLGMRVELSGDVPGGFNAGQEAQIVGFRLPFDQGSSGDIIEVTDAQDRGWVKPSNIRILPGGHSAEFAAWDAEDRAANDALVMGVPPEPLAQANPDHVAMLARGTAQWNDWRLASPAEIPRLHGVDLRKFSLREINLEGADLSSVEGYDIDLYKANLQRANLQRAFLQGAALTKADLRGADLSGASLSHASLLSARLQGANLREATCLAADFGSANLSRADLTSCLMNYAKFFDANLTGATLVNTSLMATLLIRVKLQGATLSGCRVHGAAVWKVETDESTRQTDLVVTDLSDPTVTTDNLAIAQLVHLLINTSAIRDVIDSMTGRAVLLLGRFTEERMAVLQAMASHLRKMGDLPIIFNFDKPVDRSVSETIRVLAGLSKFVIADLTDPKSSPYECHLTVPDMAVPFFPIVREGQSEFSMFEDLYDYDWLLEGFQYRDTAHLVANLDHIRDEAMAKREDIRARRSHRKKGFRKDLRSPAADAS